MKNTEKYLTQRSPNLPSRISQPKQLKFERIKKQNSLPMTVPVHLQSAGQARDQVNRKFVYDQETMSEMIQALKEENNELRSMVRVQQTQISYYEQQEKNIAMGATSSAISNNFMAKTNEGARPSQVNKTQLQNLRLKRHVQSLQQQLVKLKKSIKCTSLKQLQTANLVYQQQIKSLTAKLAGYEKSTTNIKQINEIIEKEYHTSLQNRELALLIGDKDGEIQQAGRVIRKLKNIITQKNGEIQAMRQEREKIEATFVKNKIMEDLVPKSELTAKKKQLLAMTETIEKLETRLMECQAKAQALQQENIDNMNRETNKRKQILTEFQKFKKSHQALQQALALSLKKNNDTPLRLDQIPSFNGQFKKPKIPAVVKIEHIKQAIETIVFNLQTHEIHYGQASKLIMSPAQRERPAQVSGNGDQNEDQGNKQVTQQQQMKISIRQVIYCLEQPPLGLQAYEQKQLLARYLVENECEASQHINFDSLTNISYVHSIFRRILKEYPLFTGEETNEQCAVVQDFLRRNEHTIKTNLAKLCVQDSGPKSTVGDSQIRQRKRGQFTTYEYIEALRKQNQLSEYTLEFIKYWAFRVRHEYLGWKEFECLFKVDGVCTFITEQQQDAND